MKPYALEKADTLYRFALNQGSPLETFELALTDKEADALLDWLPQSGMVGDEWQQVLADDIALARRAKDPFRVLGNFTFSGLRVVAATRLQ